MIDLGKKPYGAFFTWDGGMATNILASRLAQLVQMGMLAKKPHAADKRKAVYGLTGKGLAFMPSLLELANGSAPQPIFPCGHLLPRAPVRLV